MRDFLSCLECVFINNKTGVALVCVIRFADEPAKKDLIGMENRKVKTGIKSMRLEKTESGYLQPVEERVFWAKIKSAIRKSFLQI